MQLQDTKLVIQVVTKIKKRRRWQNNDDDDHSIDSIASRQSTSENVCGRAPVIQYKHTASIYTARKILSTNDRRATDVGISSDESITVSC